MKQVNSFFTKDTLTQLEQGTDFKRLIVKHLFRPDGKSIDSFDQIQSEQIFLIASSICTFKDLDPRIT